MCASQRSRSGKPACSFYQMYFNPSFLYFSILLPLKTAIFHLYSHQGAKAQSFGSKAHDFA
jgi:hypothetical protein